MKKLSPEALQPEEISGAGGQILEQLPSEEDSEDRAEKISSAETPSDLNFDIDKESS